MADRARLTFHYGDRSDGDDGTWDNDRTGLPDDCLCLAIRHCDGDLWNRPGLLVSPLPPLLNEVGSESERPRR